MQSRSSNFANWIITLSFDDHKYHVTDRDTKEEINEPIISVTEFSNLMFPKFEPKTVVSKMKNRDKYENMTNEQIIKYWNDNAKHASEFGSLMHSTIETYLTNILNNIHHK